MRINSDIDTDKLILMLILSMFFPSGGAREYMNSLGYPIGLQNTFIASFAKFPMRYYIIDDSGSMESMDGKKIVIQSGRKT